MKLSDLPNIGTELEKQLISVGIKKCEDLFHAGTENAFIKINAIDESACINRLYAIEGAIQQIRWHNLNKERKEELKHFFNQLKRTSQ